MTFFYLTKYLSKNVSELASTCLFLFRKKNVLFILYQIKSKILQNFLIKKYLAIIVNNCFFYMNVVIDIVVYVHFYPFSLSTQHSFLICFIEFFQKNYI